MGSANLGQKISRLRTVTCLNCTAEFTAWMSMNKIKKYIFKDKVSIDNLSKQYSNKSSAKLPNMNL